MIKDAMTAGLFWLALGIAFIGSMVVVNLIVKLGVIILTNLSHVIGG